MKGLSMSSLTYFARSKTVEGPRQVFPELAEHPGGAPVVPGKPLRREGFAVNLQLCERDSAARIVGESYTQARYLGLK
jgi:hypothetical protein